MLFPKKTNYRKYKKGRIHGVAQCGNSLSFGISAVRSDMGGCYGLKAMSPGRVTSREIEAARKAVMRSVRRHGNFWINVFPDIPVSSKPAEVRMGKGKGDIDRWVCRVMPGTVIFEMNGVSLENAIAALALASAKLSVKTKFVQALDSGMLVGAL